MPRLRALVALLAVAFAVVAVAWLALGSRPAPSSPPLEYLTVDFSHPEPGTRSVAGLLHGLGRNLPVQRWLAPLRPALIRGDLQSASYDRAVGEGARYVIVLSDLWGYPRSTGLRRAAPYADLDAWEQFVREVATENRDRRLVWEIWNEPDRPEFWAGSREQFQETFLVAERALRDVLGDAAVVAGPGVSAYSPSWLRGLFDFCRERGCRVDALTWHEFPSEKVSLAGIADHVRRGRSELVENPAYRSVGAREIAITEYGSRVDRLYPGEAVGYLYYLEQGGADAAARACWPDSCGRETCGDTTLGGLLDHRTMRPRAVWWTLSAYARGVESRVWSAATDPSVVALASQRAPDRRSAQVLLGYFDSHSAPAEPTVDVRIELRGLDALSFMRADGKLSVRVQRMRSAGHDPARPTDCGAPLRITARDGRARLVVRGVRLHDAMLLTISRGI